MILQILNIAGGAVIASEKIAAIVGQERNAGIKEKIAPLEPPLGAALIIIGLVGLFERLGLFYLGFNLGSSFPQVLPLIATGLVMAVPVLEKNASLKSTTVILRSYASWIGFVSIACGLGSLLFGCIYPICYPLPF